MRAFLLLFFLLAQCILTARAQQRTILIKDAQTRIPVPFAAVRLGTAGQGVIADLDGKAALPQNLPEGGIGITALGYEALSVPAITDSVFFLKPKKEILREVVVKPDEDKLRRIITRAVAHRDKHNPDKYDRYQCHVYYKMVADAAPVDTSLAADTSKKARELRSFLDNQHLLMSETYSIRTAQRPQKLQEEVLATRLSGFKTPLFTSLVTDVLPFHAYTDYLHLNGRDFRNPVSRGSGQWFRFNLRDELLQGSDTTWIISFFPRRAGEGLRGTVYIHSGDYAITNLIGAYHDTALRSSIRVEQQYAQVEGGRWFPRQLNYVYRIRSGNRDSNAIYITLQGTSRIDSVSFNATQRQRFDRVHTVKIMPGAEHFPDTAWAALRPLALDGRESRTYVFMDSLMGAIHADRFLPFLTALTEGKIPVGPIDIDLARLYRYNSYEGSRFGLGLQTGDEISRHFSVGAWGGYGMADKAWKWGAFGEVYFDRYKETALRIGYERDLRDPGRLVIAREIDANYLRNYLMQRADAYEAYNASFRFRLGYLQAEVSARHEEVSPRYAYAWVHEGRTGSDYAADEASVSLRYAFAERSAPMFGRYYATGSSYPVLYARGVQGRLCIGAEEIGYTQAIGAVTWRKHIACIGLERWLVRGGKIWSNAPLPIGKLFAGPGLRHDQYRVYVFGGLQTVYPYDFYSDAFASWSWRHDFDWNLWNARISRKMGSRPGLSLVYNGLWGTLDGAAAHNGISFRVPSEGYHEGGLMLHDLLRLQYLNLYYIGFGAGYFRELRAGGADGVFVFGVGVSL